MAITTMDGLAAAVAASQDIVIQKATMVSAAGFWSSLWAEVGNPAAGNLTIGNTANGLVPTDATAGAPIIAAFTGANTGYLCSFLATSTSPVQVVLYDRLFHVGSISAASAVTTTLTTQPSFAGRVPGSNWGECEIWVEINVLIPATATTVVVNYQDGNNVAQNATQMQGASLTGAPTKRMIPFALANGTGVQRINSVTVATPAASGSFNVVVLRTLARHNVNAANIADARQDFFRLGGQTVYTDSCLALMVLGVSGTASGSVLADFQVGNG